MSKRFRVPAAFTPPKEHSVPDEWEAGLAPGKTLFFLPATTSRVLSNFVINGKFILHLTNIKPIYSKSDLYQGHGREKKFQRKYPESPQGKNLPPN
jgi:hypothetical protein